MSPDVGRHDALLTSLGLALILAGQPIAWWVRGAFFNSESAIFPASVVLLGLALLIRLRPLGPVRLEVRPDLVMLYALGWLVPVAMLSAIDLTELGDDLGYALFMVAVLAALMITPIRQLRFLPLAFTLVGGLSSILPLVELAIRPVEESFTRLALQGNNNTLIVGMIGGATMIAALVELHTRARPHWAVGLLAGAAFAAGLGAVILSNTRSVMLALLLVVPTLYLLLPRVPRAPLARGRAGQFIGFAIIVGGALIAAPTAAAIVLGPDLLLQVTGAATERFTGALSALTGDDLGAVDQSTQERLDVFERTVGGLTPFGHGINAQIRAQGDVTGVGIYPHFTYLQAFYDLGVAGAVWFALLHLIVPVVLIGQRLRAGPLDPASLFIILYYLYSHMDHLTHGTPYSWLVLMPVALVYAIVPRRPHAAWVPPSPLQEAR